MLRPGSHPQAHLEHHHPARKPSLLCHWISQGPLRPSPHPWGLCCRYHRLELGETLRVGEGQGQGAFYTKKQGLEVGL